MRITLTRTAWTLLVLAAAATVLLALPAGGAAASSTAVSYELAGTATTSGNLDSCTLDSCFFSSTASGMATCSVCLSGKPSSGSFSLTASTVRTFPPNPCRIKSISYMLDVTWDTGQTSSAAVSGKFMDGKSILTLSGSFVASDPVYPSDPQKLVLNNFPPNPCTSATNAITGTMTISS